MWEGIYNSYDDVITSNGSSYDNVLEQLLDRQSVISSANQYPLDRFRLLKNNLGSKATVLEIGGDLGRNWVLVNQDCDVEYHILEIKKLVDHGKTIFPEIHWHTEIPTIKSGIDILYVRTSLQYLEDMDSYISECIEKNLPKKIIIDHASFTPIDTFWTKQNYIGVNIPYCFKNFEEFDANIKRHGYKTTYEFNDESYNYRSRVGFSQEYIYPYMKSIIYEQV